MKIAIVTNDYFDDEKSLVGLYAANLIETLLENGCEIEVVTTQSELENIAGEPRLVETKSFKVLSFAVASLNLDLQKGVIEKFESWSHNKSWDLYPLTRFEERVLLESRKYSPQLIEYLHDKSQVFDQFIFLSYRNPHSLVGPLVVPHKTLFIPLFVQDAWAYLPSVMRVFSYGVKIACLSAGELSSIKSFYGSVDCDKAYLLGFPGDFLEEISEAGSLQNAKSEYFEEKFEGLSVKRLKDLKEKKPVFGSSKSMSELGDITESFGGFLDAKPEDLEEAEYRRRGLNGSHYVRYLTDSKQFYMRLLASVTHGPNSKPTVFSFKAKIVIAYRSVGKFDAVGFDVIKQAEYLRQEGFNVCIHCEHADEELFAYRVTEEHLLETLMDPQSILIYHYAIPWPRFEQILVRSKCKRIMKYHNITPGIYFERYNREISQDCFYARKTLEIFIKSRQFDYYTSDSNFNLKELQHFGAEQSKCRVMAPFNRAEALLMPGINWDRAKDYKADHLYILSVGRIAPNKNHLDLIHAVKYYVEHYDRKIVVFIVGGLDERLSEYNRDIQILIEKFGLSDVVKLIGKVQHQDMATLYFMSDLLAITSQHEGFCMPVVEAQHSVMPIVSYRSGALPETIDWEELTCAEGDFCSFAQNMRRFKNLYQHREFAQKCIFKSKRYRNSAIKDLLNLSLKSAMET